MARLYFGTERGFRIKFGFIGKTTSTISMKQDFVRPPFHSTVSQFSRATSSVNWTPMKFSIEGAAITAKTLSLDSYLQKILTKTPSIDSLLALIGVTKASNIDSLLNKIGWTKTASIDSFLNKLGLTSGASLDALLTNMGLTRSASVDAFLNTFLAKTLGLDSLLVKTGLKTVSIDSLDAYLQRGFIKTSDLDGFLKKEILKNLLLDSLISISDLSKASLLDAILFSGVGEQIKNLLIDALLKKLTIKETSLDSVIQGGPYSKMLSLDAWLYSLGVINIFLDIDIDTLLQRPNVIKGVNFDAHLIRVKKVRKASEVFLYQRI